MNFFEPSLRWAGMEQHYTQELVLEGTILPRRIPSKENVVDIATKALGPQVFPIHAQARREDSWQPC
jgi:hypothetical protein